MYETKVAEGPLLLADVKLTFSVYHQFCQPAGVRLVVSGSEEWGPSGAGTVQLVFDKAPVASSADRAWFGNISGVALGFDWNDSMALSPQFDAASRTLAYSVGPTFSIDPETVATSTSALATAYSNQPKSCAAGG